MKETKAIQILKALTPEELKNFGKFVESPYHNSSKVIVKLFKILKKYYPDFHAKDIDLVRIYKRLYPSQKYNEGTIRNAISEIGQLAEKFLSHEVYKVQEHVSRLNLYMMERKKNIPVLKDKLLEELLKKYGKPKNFIDVYRIEGIMLNNYKIIDLYASNVIQKNTQPLTHRSEFAAFFALEFMITSKLSCISLDYLFNVKFVDLMAAMYDSFDFEKFLMYAKNNSPDAYKIISMYYLLSRIFLNIDVKESNKKFKALFYENYKNLSEASIHNLYLQLVSSYARQINLFASADDAVNYSKNLLKLTDIFSKRKLWLNFTAFFPSNVFIIMMRTASTAKDYEWMRKFIEKFSGELALSEKDDIYNCSMGLYNKCKGKYEEALSYFVKIKSPSFTISFMMKAGMAECHFYLGNYETAISLTDAFMRDAERKFKGVNITVPEYDEIKYIRKLLKIVTSANLKNLDELEDDVKNNDARVKPDILKMIENVKKNSVQYK